MHREQYFWYYIFQGKVCYIFPWALSSCVASYNNVLWGYWCYNHVYVAYTHIYLQWSVKNIHQWLHTYFMLLDWCYSQWITYFLGQNILLWIWQNGRLNTQKQWEGMLCSPSVNYWTQVFPAQAHDSHQPQPKAICWHFCWHFCSPSNLQSSNDSCCWKQWSVILHSPNMAIIIGWQYFGLLTTQPSLHG